MEESEVEIPSYFLCPISLQIMRDPVTLPTGITYDRETIEQWLFSSSSKNNPPTCPVSQQPLPDPDLTPNHTLRRLIQSWCTLHSSLGIQRFPTPRPPIHNSQISLLLSDPHPSSLTKLNKILSQSDRNKRIIVSTPGAIDFLTSFISNNQSVDAVTILHSLQLPRKTLHNLLVKNENFLDSLTAILNTSASAHVVLLIKSLIAVVPPSKLISLKQQFFEEMVKALRDRISYKEMKAVLHVLHSVCPRGRNLVKAVRAGAVTVLVEMLLEEHERKACEMMMAVLDQLCGCAEGRAELVGHAAGLAVVAKKMVRVSAAATEKAVRVVYSVALNKEEAPGVVEEMMEVGVVSKLCLLIQMECEESMREMVKEILSRHFSVWRRSPCLTPRLKKALYSSYCS